MLLYYSVSFFSTNDFDSNHRIGTDRRFWRSLTTCARGGGGVLVELFKSILFCIGGDLSVSFCEYAQDPCRNFTVGHGPAVFAYSVNPEFLPKVE